MRSLQPLIQTAPRDGPIIGSGTGGGRRRLGAGSAGLRRCGCRLRRVSAALPVRDKILIAGRARPRRRIAGLASGPVRPVIGNGSGKLGARPKTKAEAQRDERQRVPFKYHATRWVAPDLWE